MAGYTLDELISKARTEMDDTVAPYLWSDDEIIDYFDEAQEEFAVITEIFKERTDTPLTVTANDPYVTLPEGIIRPRRALLGTGKTPLRISNFNEMGELVSNDDYGRPVSNWETETGNPAFLIMDDQDAVARLAPVPTADDTLELAYTRLPLKHLSASSQTTELTDRRHQRCLLIYVKSKMYNKHDADIYDPRMSQNLEAKFRMKAEEFNGEIKRKTRKPGTVKYGGY